MESNNRKYKYKFNEFWSKFRIMMNEVSNNYGLIEDENFRYISNNNYHVEFKENYEPKTSSKVVAYFEITKGSDSYFELEKTYNNELPQIFTYKQLCKSVELDDHLHSKQDELLTNITTIKTSNFEYSHILEKKSLLENTEYHLDEDIDTFMEKMKIELKKHMDEFDVA